VSAAASGRSEMRFEIRYPTGSPHTVELQGSLVVLGRDPGCDLVISDPKCSRRHAVIGAVGPGLTIGDTGSANGVFVNGKRVERSSLEPDDFVRVGEVILKVLPDEITGTVVMGPDELDHAPPVAPPEPVAKAPVPVKKEEGAVLRPAPAAAPRSPPPAGPAAGRAPRAPRRAAAPGRRPRRSRPAPPRPRARRVVASVPAALRGDRAHHRRPGGLEGPRPPRPLRPRRPSRSPR